MKVSGITLQILLSLESRWRQQSYNELANFVNNTELKQLIADFNTNETITCTADFKL